jgi:hypothetical protein
MPNASGSMRGLTSRRDKWVKVEVQADEASKLVVSGHLG